MVLMGRENAVLSFPVAIIIICTFFHIDIAYFLKHDNLLAAVFSSLFMVVVNFLYKVGKSTLVYLC